MVVINLSSCPKGLKGDLSKWLIEISTGTFVGNVNARVRDHLWEKICSLVKDGKATMAYTAQCEQRIRFRVHGTDWVPVDYDGLVLIKKPSKDFADKDSDAKKGDSKPVTEKKDVYPRNFIVIDCETTGLDPEVDNLLEIGAIKITEGVVVDQYQALILQNEPLSPFISKLTGLSDEAVKAKGIKLQDAIALLAEFIDGFPIVGYNIKFDMDFIMMAASLSDIELLDVECIDVLDLAKEKLSFLPNRKLITVADYVKVPVPKVHRSISDCFTTLSVFQKLKDFR